MFPLPSRWRVSGSSPERVLDPDRVAEDFAAEAIVRRSSRQTSSTSDLPTSARPRYVMICAGFHSPLPCGGAHRVDSSRGNKITGWLKRNRSAHRPRSTSRCARAAHHEKQNLAKPSSLEGRDSFHFRAILLL